MYFNIEITSRTFEIFCTFCSTLKRCGDVCKYCNIILVVGKYDHNGQEWDTNQSGSISVDQMSEIYRIYKVVDFCLRHRHLNRKCILILIDGQNCFQGGAGHGRTSAQDWPGRPGF